MDPTSETDAPATPAAPAEPVPAESTVPAAPAAPAVPAPGLPAVPADGPLPPSAMRASDADRDRVADVLRTAFEEGRLTVEEHAERIDVLYGIKTVGELEPLTRDLPVPGRRNPAKTASPSPRPRADAEPRWQTAEPSGRPAESPTLVAVFGSASRKGPGRVGRKIRAVSVFGGVEIDLSQATFEHPVMYIDAVTVFGGVEVRVPEGVTVRGHGAGIFGGFDVHQHEAANPDAPVVVVRGAAVFGGVDVRPKRVKGRKSLDPGRADD